jgi:DNA-binding transcriptional ArsR family regulator
MTSPCLFWDWGTAYDLFVSLAVLHDPSYFGVRGAWAAGVRARLPAPERETLEQSQVLGQVPFHWIYSLPEPKDGASVLWALEQLPPAERLPALTLAPEWPLGEAVSILKDVAARETWNEADREALRAVYHCPPPRTEAKEAPSARELPRILDLWAHAEDFGERYLEALRAYQEAFFAEEERRIRPALQEALSRAQELAGRLELLDLLEELSQGLRFDERPGAPELVLVPSFWCTPLIFFGNVFEEREAWLFGARPPNASLVPGEVVPDALLRTLKALSDPTRLRILHYLSAEPMAPAKLARRLRLRAPTVTHHVKTLRLAGLVQLFVGEDKETKRYATRPETVAAAFSSLQAFLGKGESESSGGPRIPSLHDKRKDR